jgi:bacteriocin biosynthesis cyclodehydratase domain-containing protein
VLDALLEGSPPPADAASQRVLADLAAHGVVVPAPSRPATPLPVAVLGDLGTDPGVDAGPQLAGAGLVATSADTGPPRAGLALSCGELDRDLLDPWLRSGLPHLIVRLVDGVAVVGPLVVPGATACLRCLDEHRADEDPDHLAVVQRYAAACAVPRRDGVPDPVDPLVATLITCWAVRDLRAHLDGTRPPTWSSTITLGADTVTAATWLRHPACWCAWT